MSDQIHPAMKLLAEFAAKAIEEEDRRLDQFLATIKDRNEKGHLVFLREDGTRR